MGDGKVHNCVPGTGRGDMIVRLVLEFTYGVWAREGGKSGQISGFNLDTREDGGVRDSPVWRMEAKWTLHKWGVDYLRTWTPLFLLSCLELRVKFCNSRLHCRTYAFNQVHRICAFL